MRKIINSTYITLDGAIEGPHLWPKLRAPSDERAAAIQMELLDTCDSVLMGRRTYDVMASAWPSRSGDQLSERMNSIRKLVVSNTLKKTDWNNTTVISGDVGDQLEELKNEAGQNIVQYGFGSVSRLLMERGLLDELRLWLYPQTVGARSFSDLFAANATEAQFILEGSTALSNGIIVLRYVIAR